MLRLVSNESSVIQRLEIFNLTSHLLMHKALNEYANEIKFHEVSSVDCDLFLVFSCSSHEM